MNAQSQLTPFNFNQTTVRVINRHGEAWFVAKDVAEALGYTHVPHALRMLDEDEKGVHIVDTPSRNQHGYAGTQKSNVSIVNESGLYALVLKSRKPEAQAFRRWVTSEVLPSIRKTGAYHASGVSLEPQAILNARKQLTEAVWKKGGIKVDWSQIMPDGEAALGLVGSILMSSRWLLTFDPSTLHPRLCPIPERALMLTPEQIIEQFSDFRFTAEQTRTLLNKCGDELYRYKGLADEAKDRIAHLSRQRRVALVR